MKNFRGIIDLVENKVVPFPVDSSQLQLKRVRLYWPGIAKFIEDLAELDEDIMMLYLNGQDVSASQIKAAIRKLTLTNCIVPVLCGSALRDRGIQLLLDAIVDYLPSPLDIPPVAAADPRSGKNPSSGEDDEPFSALAFKTVLTRLWVDWSTCVYTRAG